MIPEERYKIGPLLRDWNPLKKHSHYFMLLGRLRPSLSNCPFGFNNHSQELHTTRRHFRVTELV